MSEKLFNTIMRGMEEARVYMEGARDGYRVTVSPSMNAKSWAKIREAMPPEVRRVWMPVLKKCLALCRSTTYMGLLQRTTSNVL